MNTLTAVLAAITAFCKAYVAWTDLEQRKYRDQLEDETQACLNLHTPAGDIRAAILSERAKRESSQ